MAIASMDEAVLCERTYFGMTCCFQFCDGCGKLLFLVNRGCEHCSKTMCIDCFCVHRVSPCYRSWSPNPNRHLDNTIFKTIPEEAKLTFGSDSGVDFFKDEVLEDDKLLLTLARSFDPKGKDDVESLLSSASTVGDGSWLSSNCSTEDSASVLADTSLSFKDSEFSL